MNLKELSAAVAAAHPEIAPAKLRAALTTAFEKLHAALENPSEKKIQTPLGVVRVSEKKQGGEEGTATKQRLLLVLSQPKAAKADKPAKERSPEQIAEKAARKATRQTEKKAAKAA